MSEHYPRIRIHAENGYLLLREGLSLSFYMRRPHGEIAQDVMRSLEAYLRAIGPQALGWYADTEGSWQPLDDAGWEATRDKLLKRRRAQVHLRDASRGEDRYAFSYYGMALDAPSFANEPGAVCTATFWLPTEFLEEHGPERVRALALEMASPLPFCSGHAGLSFNGELDLLGVMREVRARCFRYPGMDVPDPSGLAWKIGTHVRGASWLTFLGQPTLGALGGATELRGRLHASSTTVEELEGTRAVVTLGEWPEAGDTEQGNLLPDYRELARVLEPWLYHEARSIQPHFTPEDLRRWERRFID